MGCLRSALRTLGKHGVMDALIRLEGLGNQSRWIKVELLVE